MKTVCPRCNEVTISLGHETIIECLKCRVVFEVNEEEERKDLDD